MTSPIKPLDKAGLYEVHTITDSLVGDLRMLVPMTVGNMVDPSRPCRFFGSVTLSYGMQQFPTSFEIEAATLEQAIDRCPDAAVAAGEAFKQKLEAQRVQQSILAPGGAMPTRQ